MSPKVRTFERSLVFSIGIFRLLKVTFVLFVTFSLKFYLKVFATKSREIKLSYSLEKQVGNSWRPISVLGLKRMLRCSKKLWPQLIHALRKLERCRPEAKFLIPDWGDIVDSALGLSYRPAILCSLTGRYDNPMPEGRLYPPPGTKNLSTGVN